MIWGSHEGAHEEFWLLDVTLCSPIKSTEISEEHIASIIMVDE
jgi:hypothetical protein